MYYVNRLGIFMKRICIRKLYIFLMLSLCLMTILYKLLPLKEQTADIRVAICMQDSTKYSKEFMDRLDNKNSLYHFYYVDSEEKVIADVQASRAECGFVIPENFFVSYSAGIHENYEIIQYEIPSSTLSPAITETIFSTALRVCATDILLFGVGHPELNTELTSRINDYFNSDSVFTIKDVTNGEYDTKTVTYHINIPVFEVSTLLLLFSGLLGLLLFLQDQEKGIYLALNSKQKFGFKLTTVLASIIPILLTGLLTSWITYQSLEKIIFLIVFSLLSFVFVIILGIFTRKSSLLLKLLPLIMLISLLVTFVGQLL